jgi:hypothetical protein
VTSFVRTIQHEETPAYVNEILARRDHFIPLPFIPRSSHPGDFIYLAHRGRIVGRARIDSIAPYSGDVPISSYRISFDAKSLVKYSGGWEMPEATIEFRGFQGIRYLPTVGLSHLDKQRW